jgi:polar amino acid transport system permease protein
MSLSLDFAAVLTDWPLLLQGVAWTLGLTALATVLGVSLGIVCAWTRVHGHKAFKILVMSYVELIRNTPFIVQLFFIFFGLPAMGVRLSPEWSSVLAMVINLGAYSAEIVRAGVQATPQGQIEAALSLALTRLAPSAQASLACFGESNHHRHAGLCGVWTNLNARAQLRRQFDSKPKLSHF